MVNASLAADRFYLRRGNACGITALSKTIFIQYSVFSHSCSRYISSLRLAEHFLLPKTSTEVTPILQSTYANFLLSKGLLDKAGLLCFRTLITYSATASVTRGRDLPRSFPVLLSEAKLFLPPDKPLSSPSLFPFHFRANAIKTPWRRWELQIPAEVAVKRKPLSKSQEEL